jgi:hypothetical protein
MQQTVITPGSTGIDVFFFNQKALNAAQGQVPRQSGARGPSPDYEDLGFQRQPPQGRGKTINASINTKNPPRYILLNLLKHFLTKKP